MNCGKLEAKRRLMVFMTPFDDEILTMNGDRINTFNYTITWGIKMEILDDKLRVWLGSAKFVKGKPAVYALYDKNKDIIFIGESDNLAQTFTKYVDADFENDDCKQKTAFYQREFVDNPAERVMQLLEDFKNEHGKIPLCHDTSWKFSKIQRIFYSIS